jgi:hypothetical protein
MRSYAWLVVLGTQRANFDPESWKHVEDLLASVLPKVDEETNAAAQSLAQQTLRSQSKAYLQSLRE